MKADAPGKANPAQQEALSQNPTGLRIRPFPAVEISGLVFVRIAFGAILFWHLLELFRVGAIEALYSDQQFHFTYLGFGWVRPWPGIGMPLHFAALCVLAVCLLLGLFYRLSTVLFFLGFGYVFLLDRSLYHNHYYLVLLLSGILALVPAHRSCSLDVLRRPELHSGVAPAWTIWLLRFQVGIVYFYSGLAKLEFDWLVRCQPVRLILARETDFPMLGPLFREEWMVSLFADGGLVFDLLIVPLLLWRRTRMFAFFVAVGFHLLNALLFDVGIFPWLMITLTTVFFDPSWPRRLGKMFRLPADVLSPQQSTERRPLTTVLVSAYVALQLLVPLRHHLYPGHASWSEEGHHFAWRLMHRFKESRDVVFIATDPKSGRTWRVDSQQYQRSLTDAQLIKMSGHPDLILEFSHFLADKFRQAGQSEIEIRALTLVALNGREPKMLIDPNVDLAAKQRSWRAKRWILPLNY